jgi:hypothetical protein
VWRVSRCPVVRVWSLVFDIIVAPSNKRRVFCDAFDRHPPQKERIDAAESGRRRDAIL